jgi:hypothetical protein
MKNKKGSLPQGLVSIGLLIAVVIPFLLREYLHPPMAVRFAFIIVGLGIEITGIVLMHKQKKTRCGTPTDNG